MSRAPGLVLVGALVAGLAGLAGLAGCGGLPTPSGVKVVRTVAGAGSDQGDDVRVLPYGPVPGADPVRIVQGLLNAEATSGEDDYAVARQYLAPGVDWDTAGTAQVYQTETATVRVDRGGTTATVSSTQSLVATIDGRGTYVPRTGNATDGYTLTKVRGEWRVSRLPAGLRITTTGLQRAYTPSTLWWYEPDLRGLVPEQRWLPQQATGRTTQVVRALLGGPAGPLAGAVRTAVPPGTVLEGSVAVDGNDVSVDLSREALSLDPAQARLLLVQLAATLRGVTSVAGVRLLADGQPLPAAGDPRRIAVGDVTAYLPATTSAAPQLVVAGGRVSVLPPGPALAAPLAAALARRAVTAAVPSPDGAQVAAVADGDVLVVDGAGAVRTVARAAAPALSWTQDGDLAVATPGGLLLVDRSGPTRQVPYPVGLPGPVTDLRVARDGVRVVLVAGGQAYLTAIAGGAMTAPVVLAPAASGATQVAWQDADDVLVLAGQPGQLVASSVDGSSPDRVALPPAVGRDVALAAGPGGPVLVVGDGSVESLTGDNGWRRVASGSAVGVA